VHETLGRNVHNNSNTPVFDETVKVLNAPASRFKSQYSQDYSIDLLLGSLRALKSRCHLLESKNRELSECNANDLEFYERRIHFLDKEVRSLHIENQLLRDELRGQQQKAVQSKEQLKQMNRIMLRAVKSLTGVAGRDVLMEDLESSFNTNNL